MLKFVNYVLIGIVIGMLIYIVGIVPSAFELKIASIKGISEINSVAENIVGVSDADSDSIELTSSERCKSEFNKYSEIGESKYDTLDYSLNLTRVINSNDEAKEFDNTYSNFLSGKLLGIDFSTFKIIEHNYPIIALLAEIKINQESGESSAIPIILYCYSDGTISELSKKTLTLSN